MKPDASSLDPVILTQKLSSALSKDVSLQTYLQLTIFFPSFQVFCFELDYLWTDKRERYEDKTHVV